MCLETSPPRATSLIIGSHSKQGMYLSLPMYLAFQWSYTYHVHCLRIFTWNSKADFETYIFTDVHDRKFKRNLSSNCLFSRVMILFPFNFGFYNFFILYFYIYSFPPSWSWLIAGIITIIMWIHLERRSKSFFTSEVFHVTEWRVVPDFEGNKIITRENKQLLQN
jgi:hypothetical protein